MWPLSRLLVRYRGFVKEPVQNTAGCLYKQNRLSAIIARCSRSLATQPRDGSSSSANTCRSHDRLLAGHQRRRPCLLTQSREGSTVTGSTTDRFLENRVALVTGSTSGIGLGVARGLASRGCSIILNGFADDKLIDSLNAEFSNEYNTRSDYIYADLTKTSDVENLCKNIYEIHPGGVDVLFNNAGFQFVSAVEDFPIDKWNDMIAVMLTAPFIFAKHFLSAMRKKQWGRIINLASVHGVRASPNKTAYVSAKHGIVGLTKVLALETAGSGITCNAICPGYVDTPILQGQVETLAQREGLSYEAAKAKFLSNFHPSKDSIGIEQLAEMTVFLCSDAASQMTGSSVILDGGWTAK